LYGLFLGMCTPARVPVAASQKRDAANFSLQRLRNLFRISLATRHPAHIRGIDAQFFCHSGVKPSKKGRQTNRDRVTIAMVIIHDNNPSVVSSIPSVS